MEIIIVGGSSKHIGGIERYCERFIQAFKLYGASTALWIQGNTALPRSSSKFTYVFEAIKSHFNIITNLNKFSSNQVVVWLQYGNAIDLFTLLLIRIFSSHIPLVTMHAGPQWRHLSQPIFRTLACLLLRLAKTVCVIAEWQVDFLQKNGIQRIEYIPTLLPSWINENSIQNKPRSGILYAGRISPDKGIKDLLYAYKTIVENGVKENLIIAGTGDKVFLSECHQLAINLNIQCYISWIGLLEEDALKVQLRRAKLLIYPSYADAFSLTILEALASGTPVVAYDIPGTTDIISQFGGSVVSLGNINALAFSLTETLSFAGKIDAEAIKSTYNWKRVVATYEKVATIHNNKTIFPLSCGVTVSSVFDKELIDLCATARMNARPFHICTVNPEIAFEYSINTLYKNAVDAADLRTIDGIGISLAILRQHRCFSPRLTGVVITNILVNYALRENLEVLIVGANENSRRFVETMWKAKGVNVVEGCSPNIGKFGESCVEEFPKELKPGSIVFVALGHPKQEYWIRSKIENNVGNYVFVGVGGTIDYLSGNLALPPSFIRALGIEWLYRLIAEPKKRFKRQLKALPRFFLKEIAFPNVKINHK